MRLPNYENAYIPGPKLTEYLLLEKHEVGRAKAKYFRSLGYTEANINLLEYDILMIAKSYEFTQRFQTSFGVKYTVRGQLSSPNGSIARIITVWIIEPPDTRPRFVTAYPQ
jgi:hypothetical protein